MKKAFLMRVIVCSLPALLLFVSCGSSSSADEALEKKIDAVMEQLTLDEKLGLIHAQSKFSAAGVPRLGIPELWTDDGPHGVRPETLWDDWSSAQWTSVSWTEPSPRL